MFRLSIRGHEIHLGDFNFHYREQDQQACVRGFNLSLVFDVHAPLAGQYIEILSHCPEVKGNVVITNNSNYVSTVKYIVESVVKVNTTCYVFHDIKLVSSDQVTVAGLDRYIESVLQKGFL